MPVKSVVGEFQGGSCVFPVVIAEMRIFVCEMRFNKEIQTLADACARKYGFSVHPISAGQGRSLSSPRAMPTVSAAATDCPIWSSWRTARPASQGEWRTFATSRLSGSVTVRRAVTFIGSLSARCTKTISPMTGNAAMSVIS